MPHFPFDNVSNHIWILDCHMGVIEYQNRWLAVHILWGKGMNRKLRPWSMAYREQQHKRRNEMRYQIAVKSEHTRIKMLNDQFIESYTDGDLEKARFCLLRIAKICLDTHNILCPGENTDEHI